jgi:hypothetical protein
MTTRSRSPASVLFEGASERLRNAELYHLSNATIVRSGACVAATTIAAMIFSDSNRRNATTSLLQRSGRWRAARLTPLLRSARAVAQCPLFARSGDLALVLPRETAYVAGKLGAQRAL